jgi:hypothetical protein
MDNKKYSLQEGLESLERIHSIMGVVYNNTLNEMITTLPNSAESTTQDNVEQSQTEIYKDYNGKDLWLPKGTKVSVYNRTSSIPGSSFIQQGTNLTMGQRAKEKFEKNYEEWLSQGNDFPSFNVTENTVYEFTTPDGLEWRPSFRSNFDELITNRNPYLSQREVFGILSTIKEFFTDYLNEKKNIYYATYVKENKPVIGSTLPEVIVKGKIKSFKLPTAKGY